MKISTGFLILLFSILALIAEVFVFASVEMRDFFTGARPTGKPSSLTFLFLWFALMTIIVGLTSPIAALIENATKKEKLGYSILLWVTAIASVAIGAFTVIVSLTV